MPISSRCPICDGVMTEFFHAPAMPVFCNVPAQTRIEARQVTRGEIRLACCRSCGMVRNAGFDESLMNYNPGYENSLHCSGKFQDYARGLARQLVARHDLRDADVIEIGCGRGEFLAELCEAGGNRGVGFDPSCDWQDAADAPDGVRLVPDCFTRRWADLPADLICCRHVLEHIDRPAQFLADIRACIDGRSGVKVFFEVPNSLYTFRDRGIWDIIYEHPNYFTAPALGRAFATAGFGVRSVCETYEGQFLAVEAEPTEPAASASDSALITEICDLAEGFAHTYRQKVRSWSRLLADAHRSGRRLAMWGAGSKGVTFLNVLADHADAVTCAVDINPRKQGRFIPGTGHPVISPEQLKTQDCDGIILMNPVYRQEIAARLNEMSLSPELLSA